MNNPKLNMLIRFTLEIFAMLLLIGGIRASTSGSKHIERPQEEHRGDRPAAGIEIARLTLNAGAQGASLRLRGQELALSDPASLRAMASNKPDHVVIELTGSPEWQRLLDFALQNDLPISIEVKN